MQNSDLKLSFDVDGTLLRESVQRYARELIDRGFDVWITTRRYNSLDLYTRDFQRQYGIMNLELEHQKLFDIAAELGIPNNKIRFTNMQDKWLFFSPNRGFLWHLDDDPSECNDINRFTKTVAVSCSSGSNWKGKCERIIKNKLNEAV